LAVSHDAAEPCGFHVRGTEFGLTILTDLGRADESLHDYLMASDLIVVEANHDEDVLRWGPYPSHLKRRILSPRGHLSNAACGELLATVVARQNRPRTIWLAHLSLTNNRPSLARQSVERALARSGVALPVIPLSRHGHEHVWRPNSPTAAVVQMALPLP
jgi:phosphoribosyl 1,2-cyclic phosphodiesterase